MSKKIEKKKKSYALTAVACALFFAASGVLMIMDKGLLQKSFFALSIIVLEAALIETVIFFAVLPYDKKPEHLIRGVVLLLCGSLLTAVYFIKPAIMPACIGLLICVDAVTDFKDLFSIKSSKGIWQSLLTTDVLSFCIGAAVIICTFLLDKPLLPTGILTCICAAVRFISAFMRPFAKKAAKSEAPAPESNDTSQPDEAVPSTDSNEENQTETETSTV